MLHTSGLTPAYGSICRAVDVATNVSYARVVEALSIELLAVEMLHTPETTCGKGRLLGAVRYGGQTCSCVLRDAHAARGSQRAEQAAQEVGQLESHCEKQNCNSDECKRMFDCRENAVHEAGVASVVMYIYI